MSFSSRYDQPRSYLVLSVSRAEWPTATTTVTVLGEAGQRDAKSQEMSSLGHILSCLAYSCGPKF